MTTETKIKEVIDFLEAQCLLRNGPTDIGNFMKYEKYLHGK